MEIEKRRRGRDEGGNVGRERSVERREGKVEIKKKFPIQILGRGKHALLEKEDHIQPSMPDKAIQLEPSQHHVEINTCKWQVLHHRRLKNCLPSLLLAQISETTGYSPKFNGFS